MLSSTEATAEATNACGLNHRVHEPEGNGPHETAVLFHGRAGNAQVMWTFSRALRELNPLVVSPEAHLVDEQEGGFSWWSIFEENGARKKRTSAEDLLAAHGKLEKFLQALPSLYSAKQTGQIAFGFSQGGAVAASYALRRPEQFRAVALLASFIPSIVFEDERLLADSVRDRRAVLPQFLIIHGSQDKVIDLSMAERAKEGLERIGAEVEFHVDPVGHKVGAEGIRVLERWVNAL